MASLTGRDDALRLDGALFFGEDCGQSLRNFPGIARVVQEVL